ncbi:MAG: GntR family transcriptional regulator [Castellaniella sp.]
MARKRTKEPLVDVAHRELERRFVTLELAPGSIWRENELAELLEIGRTPVREALLRMASDQLVTVLRGTGIMISTVSIQDQLYVVETRRALERIVSVRAARSAMDDERAYLRDVADKIESAGHRGDVLEYLLSHFEVKRLVAEFARNPYAARALRPLHTFSQRFYFIYYKRFNNLEEVGTAHADLSRAIAAGDLEATAACSERVSDIAEAFTRNLILQGF